MIFYYFYFRFNLNETRWLHIGIGVGVLAVVQRILSIFFNTVDDVKDYIHEFTW